MKFSILFTLGFICFGLSAMADETAFVRALTKKQCNCNYELYKGWGASPTCFDGSERENIKSSNNSTDTEHRLDFDFVSAPSVFQDWNVQPGLFGFEDADQRYLNQDMALFVHLRPNREDLFLQVPKGVPYIQAHYNSIQKCHYDNWGKPYCDKEVEQISDVHVIRPASFKPQQKWINTKTKVETAYSTNLEAYANCLESVVKSIQP